MPKHLDEFQFMTRDADPIPLRAGERVHVDLVDQDKIEGRVVSWSDVELVVQLTPAVKARPRWAKIARVVLLDRPRA